MTSSQQNIRGFTLFEIMVAVSIFAVIGAIAMSNLIQVGRSGERISAAQQQLSDIQFAMSYMGKDLTQLVNRKVRDQYGDEQHQFVLTDDVMIFTRSGWANLLQQNRSQLQRVAYRLEDEQLMREYWIHLDQGYSEQKIRQALLRDVEDFEVRLITRGKDKLDSWPPESENGQGNSPVAVEFSMQIKGFGEISRIFEVTDALL